MGLDVFGGFIAFFAAGFVFTKLISLGNHLGAPDNGEGPKNIWQWVWFLFSIFAFFVTAYGLFAVLK